MIARANNRDPLQLNRIACAYLKAKEYVLRAGFDAEIDWQETVCLSEITEHHFLRESAWVILCAGMREAIVRRLFGAISAAFLQWNSAEEISRSASKCRRNALKVFRHPLKMDSILNITRYLEANGISYIKERVKQEGPKFLLQFPYIGPVTSKHLAKNLGVRIAKPDRHLLRIASVLKYSNVDALCDDIAAVTQHPVHVIDLVLWRYATLNRDYVAFFADAM